MDICVQILKLVKLTIEFHIHCAYIVIYWCMLTLKVLVMTINAQWEGMGDVGSARYEPGTTFPMPDHKDFKLQ